MVITLDTDLESTLQELAKQQGVAPEQVALDALREKFLAHALPIEPKDEWERRLLGIAKDCGVTLPDSTVSSEGLYE